MRLAEKVAPDDGDIDLGDIDVGEGRLRSGEGFFVQTLGGRPGKGLFDLGVAQMQAADETPFQQLRET